MNLVFLVAIAISIALGILFFVVSKRSLKSLKTSIEPYYSFDLFSPQASSWSVIFFLALLSLLILVFAIFSGIELNFISA